MGLKGQTSVPFENMVSWRQEPRAACSSAEVCDISTHASVVVTHTTESIMDGAIWDAVHLRMKSRMHRVCNRAELVFEHH